MKANKEQNRIMVNEDEILSLQRIGVRGYDELQEGKLRIDFHGAEKIVSRFLILDNLYVEKVKDNAAILRSEYDFEPFKIALGCKEISFHLMSGKLFAKNEFQVLFELGIPIDHDGMPVNEVEARLLLQEKTGMVHVLSDSTVGS